MALSTKLRLLLNQAISPLNLQVSTLTAERNEKLRLDLIAAAGLFDKPVYALLPGMEDFRPDELVDAYTDYLAQIERLRTPGGNDVGYLIGNDYFTTPDMEVLYLLVRSRAPRRIVEVGCGNSTRISRQAIIDGGLNTRIIAVDPSPRNDIKPFVDQFESIRLEHLEDYSAFEQLDAGDFLFIDSSHQARVGNDVARLCCDIIPRLRAGVVLHFHDIFLPYEYPPFFARQYPDWGEQYVVHALLQGRHCEVIWPGHYVQRARPDIAGQLPFLANGQAQSFWVVLK